MNGYAFEKRSNLRLIAEAIRVLSKQFAAGMPHRFGARIASRI